MKVGLETILKTVQGQWVNSEVLPSADAADYEVLKISALSQASQSDLAFFFSKEYSDELATARPRVLLTGKPFVKPLSASGLPFWKEAAVVTCDDPYLGMARLTELFVDPNPARGSVIHPSATVDPAAKLGEDVQIGPNCVVEARARIGARTILKAGCFVGHDTTVGTDCLFFANVSVYDNMEIGNRVRLHSGAVIGSDGFGYAPSETGPVKIHHFGRVVLGDDCEIGANACVDRATFGETRLARNVKIDNLVQVAHNVEIGEGTVVCGCTALAGGVKIGRFAMIGGVSAITNRIVIGDRAQVAALCLVTKDIPAGGTAVGVPQRTYTEHFKAHATLNRLMKPRNQKDKK